MENQIYRDILKQAPEAILFADREGVIRLWNAGAEAMFGYPAEQALGRSLDLIIPERLRGRHWEGYARVMAGGASQYGRELLCVPALTRDGGQISSEFSIVMLRDDQGELLGVAAVMRDVSARRQKEKELKDKLAALAPAAS
ncbi:MAG: PAS domain S-box protein [Desulfuromonadales bacterium]|nr:PAS domain S-box protein [Desulfuromonadales bacterium]